MIVHGFTDNDLHPPVFGATQRLFGLYRGMARQHRVDVLTVVPNRTRSAERETVAGVNLVRRKAWYTSLAWRLERAGLAPLYLASHGHRAQAPRFTGSLPGTPDVVIADLMMAGVLERHRDALRVYHAHNVESEHFRSAGPRLIAKETWTSRLRDLEARAADRADRVVAVSEEDAARFETLYGVPRAKLVVVPNGYDETAVKPPDPASRSAARRSLGVTDSDTVALFMGSDVPHNRAGLSAVLDSFAPLGREGFKLLVVGGISAMLEGREQSWRIVRPATVDLSPLLHAADVGLNPALTGGGSNVKLPTYLAAGLAVVSTAHGLRGYPDLAPWVQVAEPAEFADAVRARPKGWNATGAPAPPPLEAYAWGSLGENLGARLAAERGVAAERDARTPANVSAEPAAARRVVG